MVQTVTSPPIDQLFLKWKQLLEEGTLTTAASLTDDRPELVEPLQHLINAYIAERSAVVDRTLSIDADNRTDFELAADVPGFTVLDTLGGGGMGVVYRVRDRLDREFALKRARSAQLSPTGRERFLDEARAMSQLNHPHVVPIHHFGEHDGNPYFLMPIYPASLANRMADYAGDPVKAMRLMAGVANGLGHLHSKGFVHRDLKPQNILIAANGQAAVSDFGLVKNVAEFADEPHHEPGSVVSGETKPTGAKKSRTVAGVVVGTRAYMAPEQAAGLIHLANPKWDVWSLGIVLHELLTGRRPPSAENPASLLDPGTPDNPLPSRFKPALDPRLERIVRKCLARDERDRYANGGVVARDLDAWVQSKSSRPSRMVVAATLLLIVATAIIAATILRDKPKKPPDPKAELLAKLARKEMVELIGESGKPAYYRIMAARPGTNPIDEAPTFTVSTQEPILIELVPAEANLPGFYLKGDVQFVAIPGQAARAGFYANHRIDDGDHEFIDWTFAEFGASSIVLKKVNDVEGNFALSMSHLADAGSGRPSLGSARTLTYKPFATQWPGPDKALPQRFLGLRLNEQSIALEWQNAPVDTHGCAHLDKFWKMSFPTKPRPPIGPSGGIGLYVTQGAVVFRNVTLAPDP